MKCFQQKDPCVTVDVNISNSCYVNYSKIMSVVCYCPNNLANEVIA